MAALACLSERTAMRIIPAVARIAIRGQGDLGHVLGNVAGVAIKASVRSCQRVTGLRIVIKAPSRPSIWVVALRAIRPEASFMMLVAVAGGAIPRRALEGR